MFKFINISLALILSAIALANAATAQPIPSGPYVSGSIGYMQLRDNDFDTAGVSGSVEYEGGFAANIAFGYRIGGPLSAFRVELEAGYAQSGYDEIDVNGFGATSVSGDLDIYSASINAFVDIPITRTIQAYVGGGVGLVYYESDDLSATVNGTTVTGTGDSETDLGLMGEIGLSYFIQPNLAIVPAYRFIWIDNEADGFDNDTAHLFKVGVRYHF